MFFSASPAKSVAFLATEGWETNPPEVIDKKIARLRRRHDDRLIVVVVEGSLTFMRNYDDALEQPDVLVFCGAEQDLERLGVPVFDKGWTPARSQRTIDEILSEAKVTDRQPTAGNTYRRFVNIWSRSRQN